MSDIPLKRPDDGNWRFLSGRELDYLSRIEEAARSFAACSATCTSHVTHACEKCGQQHSPRKLPSERLKELQIQRCHPGMPDWKGEMRYFKVSDVARVAEELEKEGL
jgi:hypothetical protein